MKSRKQRWSEALRSGEYEQRKDVLRKDGRYCCLGVLAELDGALDDRGCVPEKYSKGYYIVLSEPEPSGFYTMGLDVDMARSLAHMNDGGASFSDIADFIEESVVVEEIGE